MVFSDPDFLFYFLPIVLTLHSLVGARFRNGVLLVSSLAFYAWGEGAHMLVMLASIGVNYRIGLRLGQQDDPKKRKSVLWQAIAFNLGMLVVFKYTNFLVASAYDVLGFVRPQKLPSIHLPIGISFFTFQAFQISLHVRYFTI